MLKLGSVEPTWIQLFPAAGDEPAVTVLFAPIGMKAVRAARRAVADALSADPDNTEEAADALSRELIRRGLLDWRGVGDAAGDVIAVSPEAVELFLADPRAFEAADRVYVLPWYQADAEKNGSSASPSGTGKAATTIAEGASPSPDTAADPIPTPAEAAAPTTSTSPGPKKGRSRGKRSSAAATSSA